MKTELGQTGVEVFRVGLGVMPLSLANRPTENAAIRILNQAIIAGINLIDTADVYSLGNDDIGHNERLIQKALKIADHGTKPVAVITKGGCTRPGGGWGRDGSPAHLRKACERSLANLGVESIFLYQLHAPGQNTSFEKSIETLAYLQNEGKIHHIGLSNVTLEQIRQALAIVRIETVQNHFNIFSRHALESGVMELCEKNQISFLAHSPMGGILNHQKTASHPLIAELSQTYRCSPYQILLSWILQSSDCTIPIPGASKITSVKENVQAVSLKLLKQDMDRIDSFQKPA